MKILIAPDKFKGSLTASEVCDAVEVGILKQIPDVEITKIPLADGGDGSLEILEQTLKFERIYKTVNDPLFRPIKAFYGRKEKTAYIEMTSASGLQLLKDSERNPRKTTSFGTGELIKDALDNGANEIYLFVGGSATNDAGIGIASALGYKFCDKQNNILKPIGENLAKITTIANDNAFNLGNAKITVLSDVSNPLHGKNGAAYVYSPQKGADEKSIIELDKGLINFAEVVKNIFGKDISQISGGGAAGGVGAGAVVFLNAGLKSGIETILDLLNINRLLLESDLIITGEGLIDRQTLAGKVVHGIMNRCKKAGKPLSIVCGDISLSNEDLEKLYFHSIYSIKNNSISKETAIKNAYNLLIERTEEAIKGFNNNWFTQ